jgi:chromate transporter
VRVSLLQIALVFGTISLTAFGGGQKASIRRSVVTDRRWLSDDEFLEGLELAQIMPGPNIVNLAVYVGQRIRGTAGAAVAFTAMGVPAFLIVLLAGAFYFSRWNVPAVRSALLGASAGAVGLTLANALELSLEQRTRPVAIVLIAATAIAVSALRVSLPVALLVMGSLGIWSYRATSRRTP